MWADSYTSMQRAIAAELDVEGHELDSVQACATTRLAQATTMSWLDPRLDCLREHLQQAAQSQAPGEELKPDYAPSLQTLYDVPPELLRSPGQAGRRPGFWFASGQAAERRLCEQEESSLGQCAVCGRPCHLDKARCGNALCDQGEETRFFRRVWGITDRSGVMGYAVDLYKVEGVHGWAGIFARMLLNYLDDNERIFRPYELIIPSPTYLGDREDELDHTGEVIVRAIEQDRRSWPFQLGVVEKLGPTSQLRGRASFERERIAATELRTALRVPEPNRVSGKRVLVFDDVYATGMSLREVARALFLSGAREVSGVVLARQLRSSR
jgi:predicted amidophosphoribosyltransferase